MECLRISTKQKAHLTNNCKAVDQVRFYIRNVLAHSVDAFRNFLCKEGWNSVNKVTTRSCVPGMEGKACKRASPLPQANHLPRCSKYLVITSMNSDALISQASISCFSNENKSS